jgi:hypothetical protein
MPDIPRKPRQIVKDHQDVNVVAASIIGQVAVERPDRAVGEAAVVDERA